MTLPYCRFYFLMSSQNVSPTVDGMLGGFAFVSPVDIDGSTEFIKDFLEVCILMWSGLFFPTHNCQWTLGFSPKRRQEWSKSVRVSAWCEQSIKVQKYTSPTCFCEQFSCDCTVAVSKCMFSNLVTGEGYILTFYWMFHNFYVEMFVLQENGGFLKNDYALG